MTFDYPRIGSKYDPATHTWNESVFPETPKGFSGGAVFGIVKRPGTLPHADYKLLGIDIAWDQVGAVWAIPIARWRELMIKRGFAPSGK